MNKFSLTSDQHGICHFLTPLGILFFALFRISLLNLEMLSTDGGILWHVLSTCDVYSAQFAFLKFHLGFGIASVFAIWLPVVITIGLCWLLGKSVKSVALRGLWFLSLVTNTRSGVYFLFQRADLNVLRVLGS